MAADNVQVLRRVVNEQDLRLAPMVEICELFPASAWADEIHPGHLMAPLIADYSLSECVFTCARVCVYVTLAAVFSACPRLGFNRTNIPSFCLPLLRTAFFERIPFDVTSLSYCVLASPSVPNESCVRSFCY